MTDTAVTDQPSNVEPTGSRGWRPAKIAFLSAGVLIAMTVAAIAVDHYILKSIPRFGPEQRLVFRLDAPYGSVDLRSGMNLNGIATIETLADDADAHNSQWSYSLQNGSTGLLRIGIGTDEGMRASPPIAMWSAHSGFSEARSLQPQPDWGSACPPQLFSFTLPTIPYGAVPHPRVRVISTDAGTMVLPDGRAGTRISVADNLPLDFSANLGFGESLLDFTGLQISNASIETGASKSFINCRSENPVELHNCSVRAGIGQCTFSGISNLNADHFSFNGAIGSYHLGFEGKLQHNLEADVELGLGMCTIIIPATACRVQVFYDDGLLSSFSFPGLVAHRDGYATSPGFNLSTSPILTLHLSSGAGKFSVLYH